MALRRTLLSTLAACAAAARLAPLAQAQASDYPNRPIKLIVPFAAGGSTDMVARLLGRQDGARILGKAVVVDNKGGAGGSLAPMPSPSPRRTATPSAWPR